MTASAVRLATAVLFLLFLAFGAWACGRQSEIVLVVDTDLKVPSELDGIEIAVTGSTQSGAPAPIAIDLTDGNPPTFPMTLGVLGDGALAPLVVRVTGLVGQKPVATQIVHTAFVAGETRMLTILLLDSCVGVICPDDKSCGATGCSAVEQPGSSLPSWTGALPGRPARAPTVEGRSVWSTGWHSTAVDGAALYAWGQNSDGQLGIGTTQSANARRPTMNITDPSSIGLGNFHSCVCDRSKQAWCWGRNGEGELGTGNLTAALVPTAVPGLVDCEQIAGGARHACALRTDGTVVCWGLNANGQTGQPAGPDPVTTPQVVPNLAGVAEVRCGEFYSCARKVDGAVLCWGKNEFGQLGDGTTTGRATPAPVNGLPTDVAELVTGRFFACVRRVTGQVSCWGSNSGGQLGRLTDSQSSVPVEIVDVSDALQLSAGLQHACAIRAAGRVLSCWGGNQLGQLGDGTMTASPIPVDVLDLHFVTSVSTGSVHTCARDLGKLFCWGENVVNQLGDGSTDNRSRPVSVAGF